jgi:CRP/FNR family transcriptional regulator
VKKADVTGVLSMTPLFGGLNASDLDVLARVAVDRAFARTQVIFTEGDAADGFYVVASGRVKIYKLSVDGKEQILHIYGTGQPFGEVPVFSGGRFPANAQAVSDSRLLFFPRDRVVSLIEANPQLAVNMLAVLSRRLREFTVQIENLSLKEVPGRLASYLLYLSAEQNNCDRVELEISKGQLASLLGTIPETLSRIFSRMSADGLIQVAGPVIHIADRQGLRALSGQGKLVT